ncbi:serine/threonine-protein kinase 17A [Centruroides vittatus]|uniref:serine/threonine-protein kinase 17A n=1 Tax=Centruroides vittatus TaxID=120091 RepID=UPI00350F2F32
MALNLDDNLNNNPGGVQGLLNETHCPQPLYINTQPITDVYTVESRPFARGKFATVRRCCHKETGIKYAAKYIRKRRRASDVRHEIMHEIYVLKLSAVCPRIVRLHEIYETSSEIILVLEMATGGEVQRVLEDEEVICERDASRLMRQILEGLIFLHDLNVAHLDLKPQNLLLTSAFPQGNIKLCDFGISRLITKDIEIREIVGTPDYVAPEILQYEPITLATDMWSIGVLTYVLLSGHSPFGGDSKQETFCNITHAPLEFPPEMFANISNDAKDFIQRLLVREPCERMTAKECLQHSWICEKTVLNKPIPSASSATNTDIKNGVIEVPRQVSANAENISDENSTNPLMPLSQQQNELMEEKRSQYIKERGCTEEHQQNNRNISEIKTMVVEFKGIVTNRLMFSEEIIIDERVGIVY